ncbi:MAG: hypothetical protein ACIAQZ_14965 [Sedimentisphaeraceae bacterium JB056]
MSKSAKNTILYLFIALNILSVLVMFFFIGTYKTNIQNRSLVKQRYFYEKYNELEEHEMLSSGKGLPFKVIEGAFEGGNKIFLIEKSLGSYVLTFGNGEQLICSYFPEKRLAQYHFKTKFVDRLTVFCGLLNFFIPVIIFFLVRKTLKD